MAKRKRLTPPEVKTVSESAQLKTVSALGLPPLASSRPPIAQVAGEASAQAALEEVSAELSAARIEGRMVQALPLAVVQADHLVRDRIVIDALEMDALKASLRVRGQQTPIEVVGLGKGRYGLISGWRRLTALKALLNETGDPRFAQIQSLIKPIDSVSDSYVAMVEENEIRANLSYYERARLSAEAAKLGIYPNPQRAVQALFAAASSSKRSKIVSFLHVHRGLETALSFPAAIPERLGLALASAIESKRAFAPQLADLLRQMKPQSAVEERVILDRAVKRAQRGGTVQERPQEAPRAGTPRTSVVQVTPGITLEARADRVVLSGKGVTAELEQALTDWLRDR